LKMMGPLGGNPLLSWRLLSLLPSFVWAMALAQVPPHMRFALQEGEVRSLERPELRLNARGGAMQPGDPLVLWPCSPHDHELFVPPTEEGLIRLAAVPAAPGGTGGSAGSGGGLCLQAEGGPTAGSRIIVWPCMQESRVMPHEAFEFHRGTMRLKRFPDLCVNIKGGFSGRGGEAILWHCGDEPGPNEQFIFDNGRIALLSDSEFHLNVAGGNLTHGSPVVVWSCQAGHHEVFEFSDDGRLRSATHQGLCVNAEGGLGAGRRLVLWPCAEAPEANELFEQDSTREFIFASKNPNLAFNAAGGGLQSGDEVVLWPLVEKEL